MSSPDESSGEIAGKYWDITFWVSPAFPRQHGLPSVRSHSFLKAKFVVCGLVFLKCGMWQNISLFSTQSFLSNHPAFKTEEDRSLSSLQQDFIASNSHHPAFGEGKKRKQPVQLCSLGCCLFFLLFTVLCSWWVSASCLSPVKVSVKVPPCPVAFLADFCFCGSAYMYVISLGHIDGEPLDGRQEARTGPNRRKRNG